MGSAETGFGPDDSFMCTESRKGAAGTGIVPNVLADHLPVSALQSAMIIVSAIEPGRSGTARVAR